MINDGRIVEELGISYSNVYIHFPIKPYITFYISQVKERIFFKSIPKNQIKEGYDINLIISKPINIY